jgi:hypothetical protein
LLVFTTSRRQCRFAADQNRSLRFHLEPELDQAADSTRSAPAFSVAPAAAVSTNPRSSCGAVLRSPSCLLDTNAHDLLGRLRSLLAQGDWPECFHGESDTDQREYDNTA